MKESFDTTGTFLNSVAVIGNYLPRKCGIATFTTDLVEALVKHTDISQCHAVAMNDKPEGYDYPDEVRFEIRQDNLTDYHTAGTYLNLNQMDIVSLQHEFGIFGGSEGQEILSLLLQLQMPVITTLHTVLIEPSKKQKEIIIQLAELSDRLVVMSQSAVKILQTVYDIPEYKIAYIPHGIPDIPFVDPNYYKEKFNLLGQNVLLTFGLLSQNKGIEYVIKSLPGVIKNFPNLTYIVLGATHPHVLKTEGERYRSYLQREVQRLNLSDHVIFKNYFIPFEDLCDHLASADLYITPYLGEDQITSGTLAYAMGTGKAVISTPYLYAKEMLSEGRGRLIPFKDTDAITHSLLDLLENDAQRHQMRKRAYDFNRNATWKKVAFQYQNIFQQVRADRNINGHRYLVPYRRSIKKIETGELPGLNLGHLLRLSDNTGLLQHARYTLPNRNHGYCTDDNARALIFAVKALNNSQISSEQLDGLPDRYLSFLLHAFNPETGRFHNFMSYSGEWLDQAGSEDSHARALWALGVTASLSGQSPRLSLSSKLFMQALKSARSFQSPRAIAITIMGINSYLKVFPGDLKAQRIGSVLGQQLFDKFSAQAQNKWPWPEVQLTYANGKLPHALLLAGQSLERTEMVELGLNILDWLLKIQTENGHLAPVGNQGWYHCDGKKARFDQQPLEVYCLIEACATAFQFTADRQWLDRTMDCFNWFLGQNDLSLPLYDPSTGGCRDGLQVDGVNQNEGAESTLSWLLSLLTIHNIVDEEDCLPLSKVTSV